MSELRRRYVWRRGPSLGHLKTSHPGATEITHRAGVGKTPGWAIDFVDGDGRLRRVEVKGTVGGGFTGAEFTAGELRAAKEYGEG